MKAQRTRIDYSKHLLLVVENEHVTIHHLRLSETGYHNVKFINCGGVMSVTGDFGNWIFCREFIPSASGGASEGYWKEKLQILSSQEPEEFDDERTRCELKKRIDARLKEIEYEGEPPLDDRWFEHDDDELMFWIGLHRAVDDGEFDYKMAAYRSDSDFSWDYETIPFCKKTKFWLLAVMDAFDEICKRLKEKSELISITEEVKQ